MPIDVFEIESSPNGVAFSRLINRDFELTPLKRCIDYLLFSNIESSQIPETVASVRFRKSFAEQLDSALIKLDAAYVKIFNRLYYILPITIQKILNENYSLDNQQRNYIVDFSSKISSLEIIIQSNYQVELKFNTKIYNSYDKYAYDFELYEDDINDEICNISFDVTIGFTEIVMTSQSSRTKHNIRATPIPHANLTLSISSSCPIFKYIGSYVEDEILQIESIDQQNNHFSSSDVLYHDSRTFLAVKIDKIVSQHMLLIGSSIETIISIIEKQDFNDLSKLLSSIHNLFDCIIKIAVLIKAKEHDAALSPVYQKLVDTIGTLKTIGCNMIHSTCDIHGNPGMFYQAYENSIKIFTGINEEQFNKFMIAFRDPIINQIRSLSEFVFHNVESFLSYKVQMLNSHLYKNNSQDLIKLTYTLSIAIDIINAAISKIISDQRLLILGVPKPSATLAVERNDYRYIPENFQNYCLHLCIKPAFFILDQKLGNQILWNVDFNYLPSLSKFKFNFINNRTDVPGALLAEDTENESKRLLYYNLTHSKKKLRCCPLTRYSSEQIAALWSKNPAIKGINDGLVIYFAIKRLLTIYPDAKQTILPYLTVINISAGVVGMLIGRNAILHPAKPNNIVVRIWEAGTDGLLIFVFNIGVAINTYLFIHPNNKNVSDLVFWGEIASVPALLAICYTVWYSMPHNTQCRSILLNKVLDFLGSTLLCGGIIGISSSSFFKTSQYLKYKYYIGATIIIGAIVALIQHTKFKERLNLVLGYLTAINLSYMLIDEIITNYNTLNSVSKAFNYTQIGFWVGSLAWSIYFTAKKSAAFVNTNPIVVIESIPSNVSHSPRSSNKPPLDTTDYRAIENIVDIMTVTTSVSGSKDYSPTHSQRHYASTYMSPNRQKHHSATTFNNGDVYPSEKPAVLFSYQLLPNRNLDHMSTLSPNLHDELQREQHKSKSLRLKKCVLM